MKKFVLLLLFFTVFGLPALITKFWFEAEEYGCELRNLKAKKKYLLGDNKLNYYQNCGKCGTCKYRQFRNKDLFGLTTCLTTYCDLSGKEVCKDESCQYYKMHRCFKKYEGRL